MYINNFIVIVLVLLFIVNEYKKNIELNKRLDKITKENFTSPQSSIDAVSVSNLANLAQNIISNHGRELNLNFETVNYGCKVFNINDSKIRMKAFRGMVCPFYVETNPLPQRLEESYWYLCDGKDDRPNLMGRFIYGGLNFKDTGGETTHKLSIDEMPSHRHRIWGNADDGGYPKYNNVGFQASDRANNDNYTFDSGAGNSGERSTAGRTYIYNTGGNQPHNMPPYGNGLLYLLTLS